MPEEAAYVSHWRIETDAKDKQAALKHLTWTAKKLRRTLSDETVAKHHHAGFQIAFQCPLVAVNWSQAIYDTITLAQDLGHGWCLLGHISEEVDSVATRSNVPGVRFMHVRTQKPHSP